jgi:hypothetical protein
MDTYATIILPVAYHHLDVLPRAMRSALLQTVPTCVIAIIDDLAAGPGALRNYGVSIAPTPFVTFLDADDTLHPSFIEDCLNVWEPGHYVYTDHNGGRGRFHAAHPRCIWRGGTWHVVSTLLPTGYACANPFNETMTGGEDGEFYRRLRLAGVCGIHVPKALMEYRAEGQRSVKWLESAQYAMDTKRIVELYGDKAMTENEQCGTCGGGGNVDIDIPPIGEPQEGFVLARAMWGGNGQRRGHTTGRLYARAGNGRLMYIDARDVDNVQWERATPAQSQAFKHLQGAREIGAWLFNASDAPYNPFAEGDEALDTTQTSLEDIIKLAYK